MTSQLIAKGHRRIAYAPVMDFNLSHYYLRGYHQALELAGISPDVNFILEINNTSSSGATRDEAISGLKDMLTARNRPDALILTGGIQYFDFFDLLDELGISTPDDLEAVIMIDSQNGIPPGVPRKDQVHELAQPFMALGREAVKALIKVADGRAGRQCIEFPFEFKLKNFNHQS